MRGYATFFVVACMTLGLLFLLTTRTKRDWDAPAADPEPVSSAADAGVDAAASASASASANVDAAVPSKPEPRGLRIATLGWELAVAGVALENGPKTELAPETSLDAVETRLGNGGENAAGADIAIVPLPTFVQTYERLKTLDLRAFAVVGFSKGREELHAAPGALVKAPAGGDEVKVVALAPSTAGDATARAGGSESATALGLFALDLLGVQPSRLRFVAPGAPEAKSAILAAIVRGANDDRKLVMSTDDASRFIPFVAIAPKGQLDAKTDQYQAFAKAWLEAMGKVAKDGGAAAQKLASKSGVALAAGVGGAPEALVVIERLGRIEATPIDKQQVFIGPAAKSPVTLATLLQRMWQLERASGIVSSATPDPLPIDARVATAIAPAPAEKQHGDSGDADAGTFGPIPAGATTLVVYRAPLDSTADSVASQIAFLSGVFERASFRVTAKGGEKAARGIAAAARDKHDVSEKRLATANGEPPGAFASVEVLALP
jgi:hypothetical protein